MEASGNKSNGNSYLGLIDRQWGIYAVLIPLSPAFAALLIQLCSDEHPLTNMANDGSLVMFCFVTVWLPFGALRQQLRQGNWNRSIDSAMWTSHDRLLGIGIGLSFIVGLLYGLVVLQTGDAAEVRRIGFSVGATIFGLIFARFTMALHYAAAQRS